MARRLALRPGNSATCKLIQVLCFCFLLTMTTMAGQAEQITLTFMHWSGTSQQEGWDQLIAEFEAANPGIKVQQMPISSDYAGKIRIMLASDSPPDIFMLDMQEVQYFGQNDLAIDLRPLAESQPGFRFEEMNRYALEIMSYNGKLLGMPYGAGPNIYFFNADMFDNAGIEYPSTQYKKGGWTWSDFRQAAMKLTHRDPDGKPQVIGAERGLHRIWMWTNGAAEFDNMMAPTKCLYDAPESVATFEFLQNLMHTDRVMAVSTADFGNQNNTSAFSNGAAAMIVRYDNGISDFGRVQHLRFGIAPYPKGPSSGGRYAADFATSGYAIPKNARHPEASWKFIAFISSREGQIIVPGIKDTCLPTRSGALVYRVYPSNLVNPDLLMELTMLPNNGNRVRLLSPDQRDINSLIQLNPIWQNQQAPRTVLESITEIVNNYLREKSQK
ncbi:MAG TPA: sugar ABC transporter substrate-binding protein [Firmicutes bacterium]|nr:sugar ABC transporter substrate-binding protein [Bacillota bacterium]